MSRPASLAVAVAMLAMMTVGSTGTTTAPTVSVTAVRLDHRTVHLTASMAVAAPPARIWQVLTDYDHLATFIPHLTRSRVQSRSRDALLLEQQGRAGWWVLRTSFRVVFRVTELPPRAIHFEAMEGDFQRYEGTWELRAEEHPPRVLYTATVRPKFPLPATCLAWLQRRAVREGMTALAARMMGS